MPLRPAVPDPHLRKLLLDDTTFSSGWRRTVGLAFLISLGSVLILFPAWLPREGPQLPVEDGAVEILQVALLSLSAAILLAASAHAGRFRPIYQGLAWATIAATMGELEDALGGVLPGDSSNWVVFPPLAICTWKFVRHRRESLRFIGMAARHPSSGFIAAALIIIYVFSRFFGSQAFWRATLETGFPPDLPRICSGYLELLSCYFIFVGVLGFCFPFRRRPTTAPPPDDPPGES